MFYVLLDGDILRNLPYLAARGIEATVVKGKACIKQPTSKELIIIRMMAEAGKGQTVLHCNHTCSCCNKVHRKLPLTAILVSTDDNIWFNCNCKSTLLILKDKS